MSLVDYLLYLFNFIGRLAEKWDVVILRDLDFTTCQI